MSDEQKYLVGVLMKRRTKRVHLVARASALERTAVGPRVMDVAHFLAMIEQLVDQGFESYSRVTSFVLSLIGVGALVSAGYGPAKPDVPERYHLLAGRRYLKRCQAYPALGCKVVLVLPSLSRTMNLHDIPDCTTHVIVGVHVSDGVTDEGEMVQSCQVADEM